MKFKVFYAINPGFGYFPVPKVETLFETHRFVKFVEAKDLEDVFCKMQGENWSPNGEARKLIRLLGLKHTSMSIGDVISDGEDYWMVAPVGFVRIS